MSLIQVTNLTFAYDGSYDPIFDKACFQLDTDWRLGFTGRNGRGKTTFLRLLLGELDYAGHISADVEFDYFPFPVDQPSDQTLDVIDRLVPDYAYWELKRELTLLRMDEDVLYRPFETLSSGEQTKVLLAALFLKDNRFLLIDEPTNHLDAEGRQLVSDYLRSKKGFILVSHDRAFLDNCIDHILSIQKNKIDVQKGSFSTWWENKQREDQFELGENEKLQKEIKRLTDASRRTREWSHAVEKSKNGTTNSGSKLDKGYVGHKAAKMMKRSLMAERRRQSSADEKAKLLKNIESADSLSLSQLSYHRDRLVEAIDLSIRYDGRAVCSGVRFEIEQGDRAAITGRNGSGKSSLLRLVCGKPVPHEGTLRVGSQLRISYVSQDTSHLQGDLTSYARSWGIDESLFKAILRKLDFARAQFDKDISTYSGGQKKKVLIARSLCEPAHLHVWDEPLNFIDVISRMQIEELLLEHAPTLLFVEHDREFSRAVATKTIEL
ncbi:ABC-F type ribosomal protection protein [Paenibacillus albicereus]|uniref:ABC-F type ribosomal protection protein n=1 Tax=Paenibacillus albicereus TaxID=2726185 RepID=A0A6H2GSV1_9BACL|nr:ABC-F type ribosomal protection protein [Paenibacillus albicereus]QJC50256.1 ABC-F type ribosomal protection protein [Paenibacillus albicereus]